MAGCCVIADLQQGIGQASRKTCTDLHVFRQPRYQKGSIGCDILPIRVLSGVFSSPMLDYRTTPRLSILLQRFAFAQLLSLLHAAAANGLARLCARLIAEGARGA